MTYRLGIDVGGTNTDAVILDRHNKVRAKCKHATTNDITTGIKKVVDAVLTDSQIKANEIVHAMLGTTHSTNAIVERKNLSKVAVIRLAAPSGLAIPPVNDWPEDILSHIGEHYYMVKGGYEYNGEVLSDICEKEVKAALETIKQNQIEALAICGVFSPVNHEQEIRVKQLAEAILGPNVTISLSSEIGSIGLLERENATVLNAAISQIAEKAYGSFQNVLKDHGIEADLFITQNDGTLMSLDYAKKYPVFTIASGPTNSLRGAAFLSGRSDTIVVDVGGTTTDVGILRSGFPRESGAAVEIGGVRTNFRMPDLIAIGIGGGSVVRTDDKGCSIGPDSVGYKITEEALIFGGNTLTTSDVMVAVGRYDLGDRGQVKSLNPVLTRQVQTIIKDRVEEVIDRMKFSSEPIPVVVVGGGSFLIPDELVGATEVIRPEHFEVANAIGAAIAQVSGSIDGIYDVSNNREVVIEQVKAEVKAQAIQAGADEQTIEIVELEEIALAYVSAQAVRFKAKAAGHLKVSV